MVALVQPLPPGTHELVITGTGTFFGDFTTASVAGALALYITLGLIFRPMIGVVLRGAGNSILLVAVLHSMFNRTNNEDGIAASIAASWGSTLVAARSSGVNWRPRLK